MGLLAAANPPIHLVLQRDTVKHLRAGNPWVYRDSLAAAPPAAPGSLALVKTKDGTIVAKGFYDPGSPLAFRALAVKERRLDEALITARLTAAAALRKQLFDPSRTTGKFGRAAARPPRSPLKDAGIAAGGSVAQSWYLLLPTATCARQAWQQPGWPPAARWTRRTYHAYRVASCFRIEPCMHFTTQCC
jgi:hypothetical protein